MDNWRAHILQEFAPQIARLTLVADPDGLLVEEGVLQGIQDRGFEVIPFEDHIAFRYVCCRPTDLVQRSECAPFRSAASGTTTLVYPG